jgi:NAD(P)-dependent dehydrogenase (short-subunit alcohol dehydrogenase family)
MSRLGRKSTAEEASAGVDLAGRNALVTGANTGIGKETARVLALRGANVTLACRDLDKGEAARRDILHASAGQVEEEQLTLLELDLNSLQATRDSAKAYLERDTALHLLVNNAGIMIPMERRTAEGFEAHFGINHLAHFLFTHELLPALRAAGGARVVCVSSAAMAAATLTAALDDLNWEARKFSGMRSYGDSKLMNLMFAREFTRRHSREGLVANALHPGVVATELGRDQSLPFMLIGILAMPFMKKVEQGAATTLHVATHPEYADRGGLYFSHCAEKRPDHKLAQDDAACAALWRRSCELVGISE